MADRQVVQAKDSFAVVMGGGYPTVVSFGDRYYTDDPIVKGREHLFEELAVSDSKQDRLARISSPLGSAVETAVAEPGVRRRRTRHSVDTSEV